MAEEVLYSGKVIDAWLHSFVTGLDLPDYVYITYICWHVVAA